MELYDYSNYSKVWIVGGMNGNFNEFFDRISRQSTTKKQMEAHLEKIRKVFSKKKRLNACNDMLNDSVIIVTGDCGLGLQSLEIDNEVLKRLNSHLCDINTSLFLIRGNHDDPSLFDGKTINYSNIKAIPDYSVIITSNENILCIGGAISLDRSWRISWENHINKYVSTNSKKLYWENEQPFYNENELNIITKSNIDINFVVTHSAPSFVYPTDKKDIDAWEEGDAKLKDDVLNERTIFDNVYKFLLNNNMSLKGWFYGHFHQNYLSKSKECIPFSSVNNDFTFHSIYENENDKGVAELISPKYSLHDMSIHLPHYHPARPILGHEENNEVNNWDDVDEPFQLDEEIRPLGLRNARVTREATPRIEGENPLANRINEMLIGRIAPQETGGTLVDHTHELVADTAF